MEPVLEGGNNAEVPSTAPQSPQEVLVAVDTCPEEAAIGSDYISRQKIIACKTVLSKQPPNAATQGEPCNAGRRDHATGGREPMCLRFVIKISPPCTRLSVSSPLLRINANRPHMR